jgi:hypothetical protein
MFGRVLQIFSKREVGYQAIHFDTGTANVYIGGHNTHHCDIPG